MLRIPRTSLLVALGAALLIGLAAVPASAQPGRSGVVFSVGTGHYGPAPAFNRDRLRYDIRAYLEHVDRAVGLNTNQERRLRRVLTDRAAQFLNQSARPRQAYMFPRHEAGGYGTLRWWAETDRAILHVLHPRQRAAYERLLIRQDRRYDRRYRGDW